jgi:hypothetical protein
MSVKRMNFFDGQFLKQLEFQDEQRYHLQMRRRLNGILFGESGVATGLALADLDNERKTLRVLPGVALVSDPADPFGRKEIIVEQAELVDLRDRGLNDRTAFITLRHVEEFVSDPPSDGDIGRPTRVLEKAAIEVFASKPGPPEQGKEELVVLGEVEFATMKVREKTRQEAKLRHSLLPPRGLPEIKEIVPPAVAPGATVVLNGSGLETDLKLVLRKDGDFPLTIKGGDNTRLECQVAASTTPGKEYDVVSLAGAHHTGDQPLSRLFVDVAPKFHAQDAIAPSDVDLTQGAATVTLKSTDEGGFASIEAITFIPQAAAETAAKLRGYPSQIDAFDRAVRQSIDARSVTIPIEREDTGPSRVFNYNVKIRTRIGEVTSSDTFAVKFPAS